MEVAKILTILTVTCLVNVQGISVNTTSEESVPQSTGISRNLQAPLFRQDIPVKDEFSSYFPVRYDSTNSKPSDDGESKVETTVSGSPSTILQPPSVDAPESFSTYEEHELSKELPTHRFVQLPKKPINFFDPKFLGQNIKPADNDPINGGSYYPMNPLSKQLDLPLPNLPTQSFAPPPPPARELQLPIYQPFVQFYQPQQNPHIENLPEVNQDYYDPLSPNLQLPYLTQPKPFNYIPSKDELVKPNKQTPKTFPKKYNPNIDEPQYKKSEKKNSAIDVDGEDYNYNTQINLKKPEKLVYASQNQAKESRNSESYRNQKEVDDRRIKFEEAQKRNMLKKRAEERQQKLVDATRARAAVSDNEPITSETGFNSFGVGSSFAAAPQHTIGLDEATGHDVGGERTEFQMHGQHGPHSYKFGYDTGKGKSRQFRYEERDNDGYVKGHYGFYDKYGKLQVVNYDAHPHHGFHAEGSFGKV